MPIIPGLVSITFRNLPTGEIVDLCARTGLRSIEWGGDVHVPPGDTAQAAKVAQQTTEAGLIVSSYGSYYRAGSDDPESFDAVLDSAVSLSAPRIRVWAGTQNAEITHEDERLKITEDLRRIAQLASGKGIRIALEFHSDTLTSNAASAASLLKETGSDNIDTYWQVRVGASPEEALTDLQMLSPWLCHAHVFHWNPKGTPLGLQDGSKDWKYYLTALRALNRPIHAQLEFVKNNCVEQLISDAAALTDWLQAL
jgi:sugar phosphate isomerase/epimerase